MKTPRTLAIAPMMAYTDRHFRYLIRLISRNTWLYTEMLTTGALLHGDSNRLLNFSAVEHPIAIQFGGSDPSALARCAEQAALQGYDEINLNIGCPSHRVQQADIGACLMRHPTRVAACIRAIKSVVNLPVTVKTRLGVDEDNTPEFLRRFVDTVVEAGCDALMVHARTAWLQGLNPRQNRHIPPLDYSRVYELKKVFPSVPILINGGVATTTAVQEHLKHVDGVMIGRQACRDPYWFRALERVLHSAHVLHSDKLLNRQGHSDDSLDRLAVILAYLDYIETELQQMPYTTALLKPLFGLFYGLPKARRWRHELTQRIRVVHQPGVKTALAEELAEWWQDYLSLDALALA